MKIVSPDRELILPALKDSNSLSVQLGVCTKNMIDNLIEMALKLSEEVGHLQKDNEILKLKMETFSATKRPCVALCKIH
jgi:hypothetical protein